MKTLKEFYSGLQEKSPKKPTASDVQRYLYLIHI